MTDETLTAAAPSGAVSVSGAEIVAKAREFLSVRWQHQGRTREGIDCAGLVIKVAHELGLTEFDTADYARQATDESMLEVCAEHLTRIDRASLRPGDVVVLRFDNNRHIGFAADYLYGGLSLIHAYSQAPRRVVEHRLSPDWEARIAGCFRFPGVSA